jgi:hypothetical protein
MHSTHKQLGVTCLPQLLRFISKLLIVPPRRLGTLACQVYAGQMDSRFWRITLDSTVGVITSTLGDDVIREVIVSTSWDEEESARKGRETMLD